MNTIVLMTDFGSDDHYVGAMKGNIKSVNSDCDIIDLTHGIQSQNIKEAAITILNNFQYFPVNSIFVCVVDPGVGTKRKSLIVETENLFFIAPDNGLLTYVIKHFNKSKIYEIDMEQIPLKNPSNTFHGRDIFAFIAARLTLGIKSESMGKSFDQSSIHFIDELPKVDSNGKIKGEIYRFDKFGNAISDIKLENIEFIKSMKVGNSAINKFQKTYGESMNDNPFAYIGSDGFIEIAIKNDNYKKISGIVVGCNVTVFLSH